MTSTAQSKVVQECCESAVRHSCAILLGNGHVKGTCADLNHGKSWDAISCTDQAELVQRFVGEAGRRCFLVVTGQVGLWVGNTLLTF